MALDNKKDKLGLLAFKKTKQLNALIQELRNTTIGSLNEDVNANANAIIQIDEALTIINAKIDSLSNLFGITYNTDGTIATESYTTHTHNYEDTTINDTVDGSGSETATQKESGEVNT
ncbi:hypothetical protein [Halarcobacter anaerophilus]|uniref:Uncharacterized protein n=1 Tax=Halarcobacter anaerophilus TaxID=877500 RepID=A0A4Q0Y1V3_9BACT|nr:hypothetical protein [Halarcobacter anaerophilus]QDF29008.1 hypothetical protein AANAER_1528 [Halarcobacter anaerophilus]RXJ63643.1 hypothetical protein CRV06_05465 [Halarcobacter anaerophilus]